MAKKWTQKDLERLQQEGVIKGSFARPDKQTNLFGVKTERQKKSNDEAVLQAQCIRLFRIYWREHTLRLFAIPNGEKRDVITAKNLKRQGVVRGVCDCFLSVPMPPYSGLYIEFKTPEGQLSYDQKKFIASVIDNYKVIIVRTGYSFLKQVDAYLQTNRVNL